MSVTVGFSQASSPLVTGAAPAGAVAPTLGTDAGGADLFAMLVAMLAPGATPPPQAIDTPKPKGSDLLNVEPTAHPLPGAQVANVPAAKPPADIPPIATQPDSLVLPPAPLASLPASLEATPTTEAGKTLLKAFGAALRAAQATLQDGKPLDPEQEQRLRDTLDAVAAYFGGLPQPQPTATPTEAIAIVGQMAAGLLPTPATDLPPAPLSPDGGTETAERPEAQQPQATASAQAVVATPTPPGAAEFPPPAPLPPAPAVAAATAPDAPVDAAPASPAATTMQAKIVPEALAKLGTALKDLAAQLERQSPELAKTLAKLADRIAVGDVPDNVLAELGLTRAADSTTPELEQLAAALTATPKPEKPAAAAPPQRRPFAAVALDVLEPLADDAEQPKPAKPQPVQAEPPRPDPAKPAQPRAEANPPAAAPTAPDTTLKFDASTDLPTDSPAPDLKPSAPNAAGANSKPADPTPTQPQTAPQPLSPPAPVAAAPPVDAAAPVARTAHAAYQAPIQQVNLPQVAFDVVRQFEAGNSRFQIRLDPPELGRIDVKLDVDKSGTVSARLTVERSETLDLMQRDQRALHQALQQAGLDANKTNLEFSLRQNPFAQQGGLADGQGGNQPRFGGNGAGGGDPSGAEPAPAANLYRGTASAGGINLFV